jgi:DNA-binding NarL/FixJ family response regulator
VLGRLTPRELEVLREVLGRLTPRELEVLREMASGANNASIAASLVLSERAVAKHINAIFTKLDLHEEMSTHRRVQAVLLYLGSS